MDVIKIKLRKFNIIETQSEDFMILERKNKRYILNKFNPSTEEGKSIAYSYVKLRYSGVKFPRIYLLDEKRGYAVYEEVKGEKVSSILGKEDLPEDIYKQLFDNAYLAKINKITLRYEPDCWFIKDGVLYYDYPVVIKYSEEKDLVKRYLRLWFNTKELQQYLAKLDIFYDKNRLKDEYSVNKEMVLMTCKYYK